ncbi:hypothetical protein BPUTEOMOX_1952 [methanotrophic endosymbiont of Bathymodiolus puteoserpentis (Logatchev)]|nr:hypothetical protein BPUTEOMOX_1952 [methanotrophic endosymbiont of Bathymodiolus puteoserpentis (Logatchev)]
MDRFKKFDIDLPTSEQMLMIIKNQYARICQKETAGFFR